MKIQEIHVLIEKSLSGCASQEEERLVDQWYNEFDQNEGFAEADLECRMQFQLGKIRAIISKKEPGFFLLIV